MSETTMPAMAMIAPLSKQSVLQIARKGTMVWILLIMIAVSSYLYPGFLKPQNIINLLNQNAPIGIIALGMTFVLIAGGMDLSVGALYASGATFFAMFSLTGSAWVAAVVAIGAGVLGGLINGLVVSILRVNPFVATLGTASIFGGIAFVASNSAPILVPTPEFGVLGNAMVLGLPLAVVILIVSYVIAGVVLSCTVYGQSLYAIGGNVEAARLAGLRVEVLRTSTYILVGVASTFAGMLIASRLGVGQPDIAGTTSLDAIAIVVIGGTSLFGGAGSVTRTAIGLLLLGIFTNLFDSLSVNTNIQLIIKGAIIVAAVAADVMTSGKSRH